MKEFDHRDIYQQMDIVCYKGCFTTKPMASDDIPPSMLRKEYWNLHQSEHDDFTLVEVGLGRQRSPSLSSADIVLTIDEGEEWWQHGGGKVVYPICVCEGGDELE
ncbi:hypothetical protein Cni_G16671 [Canna indica]|uniref:Uncharacterized protein n=1 Tax=Canna indica TaxID=4628 RepID=A0AAQ3QFV6_9LILI|nr:hypothetical protein Cni_G16671 [Canna indica]